MRTLVVLLLAACGGSSKPAPSNATSSSERVASINWGAPPADDCEALARREGELRQAAETPADTTPPDLSAGYVMGCREDKWPAATQTCMKDAADMTAFRACETDATRASVRKFSSPQPSSDDPPPPD
jgi:hypothetical protein